MKPIIRLGYIDLSFHAASAALVQRVLERHDYEVQVSAAPHEDMFRRYGAGAVDMLASAWLPASHGDYLAPRKHARSAYCTGLTASGACRTMFPSTRYRASRISFAPRSLHE